MDLTEVAPLPLAAMQQLINSTQAAVALNERYVPGLPGYFQVASAIDAYKEALDFSSLAMNPWADLTENPVSPDTAWLDECDAEEGSRTEKCYKKYTYGGKEQYIVFESYHPCQDSWILLPGFNLFSGPFLIVVYFLFLVYLFLGIAIISDVFMSAIEVITSKEKVKTKTDPTTGTVTEIRVLFWNPTVANLTLMALGSSAPEILLSVIETLMTLGKAPGELGPSTIVGSAAFNLLAIPAVCMVSLDDGDTRRISELPVFLVTAFFSVFAYVWMVIVYQIWTPDIITIPEAFITLAMFPLLVGLSYAADIGMFGGKKEEDAQGEDFVDENARVTKIEITTEDKEGHKQAAELYGRRHSLSLLTGVEGERESLHTDRKHIAAIMRSSSLDRENGKVSVGALLKTPEFSKKMNANQYRINAIRGLAGRAHKVESHNHGSTEKKAEESGDSTFDDIAMEELRNGKGRRYSEMFHLSSFKSAAEPIFAFHSHAYSVMENAGTVKVGVMRGGPLDREAFVEFCTKDGTAKEGDDYEAVAGRLHFKAGEHLAYISVPIINDNEYEPDENFFVHLGPNASPGARIITNEVEVTIIDDDEPGIIAFTKFIHEVTEIDDNITIEVQRTRGCDGVVSVEYETQDGSALQGHDYVATKGILTFQHGETAQVINVGIPETSMHDSHKAFTVHLSKPTGGATLSKRSRVAVTFVEDEQVTELQNELTSRIKKKMAALKTSTESWSQQFVDALIPQAGVNDEGEEEEIGFGTYLMHYLCITWKVLFAIVPPTDYCDGWATFWVSLMFIGLVTAVVGEVAAVFGCALGVAPSITAITFVALGTSLPDTFASKQATVEAEDADAAIGNVTGSNSVNVFLGLGIPWVIASLYYAAQGDDYEVKSTGLVFSVAVFSGCACICLSMFMLRRLEMFGGAELGGPKSGQYASAIFLFCLWVAYIVASALYASSQ